jgi:type IV secretory pathway VirB10-like protein
MIAPMARLFDGLRAVPRAVRAGLWIGCTAAVLYALTLLTEGRSGGAWTSPPRRSAAAVAPAEAPTSAWRDAPAPATPEPAPPVPTQAEPQETNAQAAAEPASPTPLAQSAMPQSRGMKARRSTRRGTRHARDPIQYRLADRPGL